MDGLAMGVRDDECSERATDADRGPEREDEAAPESVEDLLALAKDLSDRLLRRQQLDPRSEWRVARALSLSVVDALEWTKGR
jgi:hypothetical protein